jgi:hypothetical protein
MKREIIIVAVIVILVSAVLSGCQESPSTKTEKISKNVILKSSIVTLANATYTTITNKSGGIDAVKVSWLLHNKVNRQVSANIDVAFYDKNDQFLYNETRQILYMPVGYTEQYVSPGANSVLYSGSKVAYVDHVVLTVTEMR